MDITTSVYLPDYYRLFERLAGGWLMKPCRFFYKHTWSADVNDLKSLYNISPQQIAIELFRINGGKTGYYLANLSHQKKYYYCGDKPEDVKLKLLKLGIGRVDPTGGNHA
ncbi:MAG: hypothetical protein PUP91_17100 [Rhizonema sp. PD37]|nr:hypothetical protein [Rhizonema sp. PD37]